METDSASYLSQDPGDSDGDGDNDGDNDGSRLTKRERVSLLFWSKMVVFEEKPVPF